MPSAPLFYQPLIRAQIAMTPVGPPPTAGTAEVQQTIHDARDKQFNFDFVPMGNGEHQIVPVTSMAENLAGKEYAQTLAKLLTGVETMQKAQPGAVPLTGIRMARDDAGWVANRVDQYLKNHPEALEQVDLKGAAEIGASLAAQAQKELADRPGAKYNGGVLDVAPDTTALMERHWLGETPLGPYEAAYLGSMMSRELQKAVTPTPPDTTSKAQWIEEGTAELLTFWPGALSKTVETLGIKADAKEIEKISDEWRQQILEATPTAEGNRSLVSLLGVAGVDVKSPEAADAAFSMLQGGPLETVPAGIAQAIVAAKSLPPEAAGHIATRIVETEGKSGHVGGLLAEIEQMAKPKPPVDPPPVDPPPVDPPPTDPTAKMEAEVAKTIAAVNKVLESQGKPPVETDIPPTATDPPPTDPPPVTDPAEPVPPDDAAMQVEVAKTIAAVNKVLDAQGMPPVETDIPPAPAASPPAGETPPPADEHGHAH